jgi:methionyl-tRNA formyltransferase
LKTQIFLIGSGQIIKKIIKVILSNNNYEICGMLSIKKEFNISYSKNKISNVHFHNIKNPKIPIKYMKKSGMKDEKIFNFIDKKKPKLIIVAGWYHLLPKKYLNIAPTFGFHGSLLPNYRGGAPLVWAIIKGEKKTGLSFFKFKTGVDNGDVLLQEKISILKNDDIKIIYRKMINKTEVILKKFLKNFIKKKIKFKKIIFNKSKIYPQRNPADGKIVFNSSSKEIYNFVRAQTHPYPGAFFFFKNKKIIAWKSKILNKKIETSIKLIKNNFYISCNDNKSIMITNWSYDK